MRDQFECDVDINVAVGKDNFHGYFAQVYTNGQHPDVCECLQCEYDQPAFEIDNAAGWRGIMAFVYSSVGFDIQGEIVGVSGVRLCDKEKRDAAVADHPVIIENEERDWSEA